MRHTRKKAARSCEWLACCLTLGTVACWSLEPQSNVAGPAAAAIRQGEQALRANDQNAAKQFFETALRFDNANVEANANLGAIAFLRGDCTTAEPHFRAALKGSPDLTRVAGLLSVCERRLGEPSAINDMATALGKLDDPKLRLQIGTELANAYYQRGDLSQTSAVLHTLLDVDPDNIDLLFFAQRVYSELADDALNKLAVLSPDSARMEQLIAERLINAGDGKDAAQHYRKAVELGPKLPGLHYELAETLLEISPNNADTQREALRELEAARQNDGDSAKIEVQLGRVATLQANATEAMSHLQRAYRLDSTDAPAQMGLAELYAQQENYAEAARYLRSVLKLDPLNAPAHYKLSQVDRQLHLAEESKSELQLFEKIRAARDKVKLLYRQMSPKTAGDDAAPFAP